MHQLHSLMRKWSYRRRLRMRCRKSNKHRVHNQLHQNSQGNLQNSSRYWAGSRLYWSHRSRSRIYNCTSRLWCVQLPYWYHCLCCQWSFCQCPHCGPRDWPWNWPWSRPLCSTWEWNGFRRCEALPASLIYTS